MTTARSSVTIMHPTGLHARPAVKLTKLAKSFPAEIRIRWIPDGSWVNAKSIVKVMGLKVRTGTEIEFEAHGDAADTALDALVGLVERNFDEHIEN